MKKQGLARVMMVLSLSSFWAPGTSASNVEWYPTCVSALTQVPQWLAEYKSAHGFVNGPQPILRIPSPKRGELFLKVSTYGKERDLLKINHTLFGSEFGHRLEPAFESEALSFLTGIRERRSSIQGFLRPGPEGTGLGVFLRGQGDLMIVNQGKVLALTRTSTNGQRLSMTPEFIDYLKNVAGLRVGHPHDFNRAVVQYFGIASTRQTHFQKHAKEFQGLLELPTVESYTKAARNFITSVRPTLLSLRNRDGDLYLYDVATNELAVIRETGQVNIDSILLTYFRPDPRIHLFKSNLEFFLANSLMDREMFGSSYK